jgi:hypothetical protein
MKPVTVGLIGCGNISVAYLRGASHFPDLRIACCADANPEAARKREPNTGDRRGDDEVMANGTDPRLGRTRRLSRTTECAGLIWEPSRGSHHQRPYAPRRQAGHMTAPDRCATSRFTLEVRGPFSNRALPVNELNASGAAKPGSRFSNRALPVKELNASGAAKPGSRFSSRSNALAATSGSKRRRCNVHNELTCFARGSRPSLAASLHPRPGGQPSHPAFSQSVAQWTIMQPGTARSVPPPTSGTARPSARCCAG